MACAFMAAPFALADEGSSGGGRRAGALRRASSVTSSAPSPRSGENVQVAEHPIEDDGVAGLALEQVDEGGARQAHHLEVVATGAAEDVQVGHPMSAGA